MAEEHNRQWKVWYGMWMLGPIPSLFIVPHSNPPVPAETLVPATFFLLGAIAAFWWARNSKRFGFKVVFGGLALLYGALPILTLVSFLVHS